MIPKIIHYSWFSGEPIPEFLQKCIDSWCRILPDYELRLWDGPALKALNNNFANEAVSQRKWAFAADFLRVYAVYHYGGIWLDTDVEMFKSLDPFLDDEMFIGREYYVYRDLKGRHPNESVAALTSHFFGAEPRHPFIGECLEYYQKRTFIRSTNERLPQELRYDMLIIPRMQVALAEHYGYDARNSRNEVQTFSVPAENDLSRKDSEPTCYPKKEAQVKVYPYQYFDQPGYTSMRDVVGIHRVAQSWNPLYGGKDPINKTTDVKKKTLGYRKMKAQQWLANWILKL